MAASSTVYLELADSLERSFDGLGLGPGARLPSEHELAARSGVSRFTARAALQELENRHVVRRTRGSGTFRALRIPYPIRTGPPPSWLNLVSAAGHEPGYEVLEAAAVRAPAHVAHRLGLARGRRVVHLRRRGLVDQQVASYDEAWFPASLVPGLHGRPDLEGCTTALLRSVYGLDVDRRWSQVELVPPTIETATCLELVGRPLCWFVEYVGHGVDSGTTEAAVPVEYTRSWMRADCFRVVLELGDPDGERPSPT